MKIASELLYPRAADVAAAFVVTDASFAAQHRDQVRHDASWLSDLEPPSVFQKSSRYPRPTDDPQDYVSIGTYWWPNPETTDGLPFVRHDGEYSPVLDQYDRIQWDLHCDGIAVFAMAHQVCGDFSGVISDWLNTWYIDPVTRMNPHLRHAQFCPGHDDGRMVGCIDFTVRLPRFIEILRRVISASPHMTSAFNSRVKPWWDELLDWLISSEVRDWHAAADNNIGVYYDRSIIYLALWLGREALADEFLESVLTERVGRQIQPGGRLPHELARTRSFDYTLMTILGFIDLAVLGDLRGMNLFTDSVPNSGSIAASMDWLWSLAASRDPWPEKQIGPIEWTRLLRLWWCLPSRYREKYPLEAIASRLNEVTSAEPERELLSFTLHPFHLPIWQSFPHLAPNAGR